MAQPPSTASTLPSRRDQARAAENEVLMREVDDAVRQDEVAAFGQRYGKPLLAVVGAGLVLFAGYLFWQSRQEAKRERQSEVIVTALDQLQAGNLAAAGQRIAPLASSDEPGIAALARLYQAGIAQESGNAARAATLFGEVAGDGDAPETLRALARVRQVAIQYDQLPPERVVALLGDQARPGQPFFGAAAELVAMAELERGRQQQAGQLFASIARDEASPETLRNRARQMAGVLGVDAVEELSAAQGSASPARPAGVAAP